MKYFLWLVWGLTKLCACIIPLILLLLGMVAGVFLIPCIAFGVSLWWFLLFLAYPVAIAVVICLEETAEDIWHELS